MAKKKYKIVYEDDFLVVLDKPSGLLTLPDRYRSDLPNLFELLTKEYGKIYVVHRLDKETSGLICFAKEEATHKELCRQFEYRETTKKYIAIVDGVLFKQEGEITASLTAAKGGKMRVDNQFGKESITKYKVKEAFKNYSCLDVEILTGRTHQIRVHLSHIGHPLAVDNKYSRKNALFLSKIKKKKFNLKKYTEERPIMSRVPLHAYHLAFVHPQTQEKMAFDAPLPKDMRALLNQLGKWDK